MNEVESERRRRDCPIVGPRRRSRRSGDAPEADVGRLLLTLRARDRAPPAGGWAVQMDRGGMNEREVRRHLHLDPKVVERSALGATSARAAVSQVYAASIFIREPDDSSGSVRLATRFPSSPALADGGQVPELECASEAGWGQAGLGVHFWSALSFPIFG